ncbi:MAG: putative toxin-antitoxin system toxin component, PIN family [Deltaproteobacteria bacterium]|nr:putative toxin-antitoxin system toxin component, PIN family [Deltaproteobacteria bacterium]
MLRVVADTNVYISALNFGGVPDQILALARRGRLEMFVSKRILDEIEGVLKRKFRWPPNRTRQALLAISSFATEVEPTERVAVIKQDEPDNRVLECALAAKATIVVSGDSHLRDLGSFKRIRILSPRAFLDAIEA